MIVVPLFAFAVLTITILKLRTVVPTNMVHIVQSKAGAVSYGRSSKSGNVYYAWPSWLPIIGVVVSRLPEANFSVSLTDYEAYDSRRLPFVVDVTSFFRISDSSMAATRIDHYQELANQLKAILQGSVRRILATHTLEEIMEARGSLGQAFTGEVDSQLREWGVTTVKTIEFMDIRDARGSEVISKIMEKDKSRIDKESRVAVAENNRAAEAAEIEASREIELRQQEKKQQIGIRTAEQERIVGIEREKAKQEVQASAKTTAEREMEVMKVQEVKKAEIQKETAIIAARRAAEMQVVDAEAARKVVELKAEGELAATMREAEGIAAKAEGALAATMREAEGIAAKGKANAEAQEKMLMAPVTAQITLAEKIGKDEGYQKYLVTIEQVKADQAVGIALAQAMSAAKMTIVANGSDVQSGARSLMDTFGAKLGSNIVQLLETVTATDKGRAAVNSVLPEVRD
ncbi:Inner membrane protein YqiK [Vulgatibacter incomptus]|uniref:Inner membrane protein YqiK n=1 Tax=Vulgatibacter incomptus TaxID=1391653 RepID=A0A0K1PI05_9BACT|nr:Inner membrane protein YqiK [Vulgatibacter incomptus]